MNAHRGDVDELLATLVAAEASLRATAAEALAPGALLRAERASTAAARRAVQALLAQRAQVGAVLEPGFAEFVAVDEALDELLARYTPAVAPPPELPAALPPPPPRRAPRVAAPAPPPAPVSTPPVEEPQWVTGLPDPGAPEDDAPVWDALADDMEDLGPNDDITKDEAPQDPEDDEATVIREVPESLRRFRSRAPDLRPEDVVTPETVEASPSEAPGAYEPSYGNDENAWVIYEEQPAYEGYEDDAFYEAAREEVADDGVEYIQYTEPLPGVVADKVAAEKEPLPHYAAELHQDADEPSRPGPAPRSRRDARETTRKAAEARASEPRNPVRVGPESLEDEWAYAETVGQGSGAHGDDVYAQMRGERMRMDDFSIPADPDESTQDIPASERKEATRPRGPRSHAAAIQIAADGSGQVLGPQEDDPDDGSVIELGDTRDYGDEEVMDDDQTGILGVGVVEYDEVEDEDEDDVEDLDPAAITGPGAPEVTPAEVSALFARAVEVSRRNMAEGVLLYSDVLDAEPDRIEALLARGRLHLDLGDYPAAISDFLKAEGMAPRDPDVQVAIGDLFYGRKDYGKAVSYFNRALGIDGDHALALARRGMAYYYRRQFNAAVEDLERAKQLDPQLAHVDTYVARARKRT